MKLEQRVVFHFAITWFSYMIENAIDTALNKRYHFHYFKAFKVFPNIINERNRVLWWQFQTEMHHQKWIFYQSTKKVYWNWHFRFGKVLIVPCLYIKNCIVKNYYAITLIRKKVTTLKIVALVMPMPQYQISGGGDAKQQLSQ